MIASVVSIYERLLRVPHVPHADLAAAIHGRFIYVGDVKLYVQDVRGSTALVLLNGGPGNSLHTFSYRRIKRRLRQLQGR